MGKILLDLADKRGGGYLEEFCRLFTMVEMDNILRSLHVDQREIDRLKRWDRVHIIRRFWAKACSGKCLERGFKELLAGACDLRHVTRRSKLG